jgi:WD40 repeat protein
MATRGIADGNLIMRSGGSRTSRDDDGPTTRMDGGIGSPRRSRVEAAVPAPAPRAGRDRHLTFDLDRMDRASMPPHAAGCGGKHTLRGHTGAVSSVTFSPDGSRIASASSERYKVVGEVKLWDAAAGQEVLTLKGHESGVTSLACSPDGLRIASAGLDGTVKVWDARPIGDDR